MHPEKKLFSKDEMYRNVILRSTSEDTVYAGCPSGLLSPISNPLFSHHNPEEIQAVPSTALGTGQIPREGPVPLLRLNVSKGAGGSIWP